jgi:hypothetical protein
MTLSKQDSAAARSAISRGDLTTLERYLREGGAASDMISVTSSTLTVNRTDHSGRVLALNRAGGITITLPAATGTLDVYTFLVQTTFTGNGIIKVASSADFIDGTLSVAGATGSAFGTTAATSDTITMSGSTTGGLAGSRIVLTDMATNHWMVMGGLVSTGTAATPFSATV